MANPKDANPILQEQETSSEFFAEFLDDYFAECDEHLTGVRRLLLTLEHFVNHSLTDRALLDELFRNFHSLKGISAMVGLREAELLAHQMESYLRDLRQGEISLTPQGMDGLVAGTRMLEQVVRARRDELPPPDIAPVMAQLEAMIRRGAVKSPSQNNGQQAIEAGNDPKRVWQFVFTPTPELSERGISVNSVRERLQQMGELLKAVPRVLAEGHIAFDFLVATNTDPSSLHRWQEEGITLAQFEEPEAKAPAVSDQPATIQATAGAIAPSSIVRVSLSRLDEIMRVMGDLVISRSRLNDQLRSGERAIPESEWRGLQETNLTMERQIRDLRAGLMRVRMVPIGDIFERMQFVARDLARDNHKQISLELTGQETEIDKLLVERMMDPLLHLVRNAVSHAVETPAQREAAGKPAEAKITLRAFTAGEMVVIEVEDDGCGIDREKVRAQAESAGLIGEPAALDDERLLDLICSPGFSTREEADRASGRGIGMAVVRNTVQALGGNLALKTESGRGTKFTIELPVTLAIADALIVSVGRDRFAVPQSYVREVIEVEPGSVKMLENNEVIHYRGGVLPVVRLARLFHLEEKYERAFHAMVIGSGLNMVAIAVDRILGQREIVVRAIDDPLIQAPAIAGATELGDGRVVLILDAAGLISIKQA